MYLFAKKYLHLRSDDNDEGLVTTQQTYGRTRTWNFCYFLSKVEAAITFALLLSIVGNVLLYRLQSSQSASTYSCISEYANLSRDVPKAFAIPGKDDEIPEEEWQYPMADAGVVALTDTYATEMGLPLAQRWPWDPNKGIYLLQGHHNLHCLKKLRTSILQFREEVTQTEPTAHIDHCLTALREDILCNADDSPRYSSEAAGRGTAFGQYRLCRNWEELDAWADANSACYVEPQDYEDGVPEIERYRRCPNGSDPALSATKIADFQ